MSRPSATAAIAYATESTFGENTSTFGTRLNILDAVDPSGLMQAKLDCANVQQLLQGGDLNITGIKGGSFKTKFYLPGHGSTTSGAMSATDIPTLLGIVLGGSSTGPTGTTCTATNTASALTTAASATFTAGQMCRVGLSPVGNTAGDSRGNGQWGAIVSHVTTTLTLLNALPAAPGNTDVVYSAETVFIAEQTAGTPTASAITGTRWLLQGANMQYECHGCYPTAISFAVGVNGSLPSFEVTWGVSWWTYSTASFPSATSVQVFNPAPGGGAGASWFFAAQGTATRTTRAVRSWTMNVALNTMPQIGVGGSDVAQIYTGAVRGPATVTVEWTQDAETATLTPTTETDWTSTTASHGLMSLSTAIGTAMGFYFPRLVPIGNKPVQFNDGGINRVKYQYQAYADSTRVTDILASAVRIGFA
jgi:hypothetical protein